MNGTELKLKCSTVKELTEVWAPFQGEKVKPKQLLAWHSPSWHAKPMHSDYHLLQERHELCTSNAHVSTKTANQSLWLGKTMADTDSNPSLSLRDVKHKGAAFSGRESRHLACFKRGLRARTRTHSRLHYKGLKSEEKEEERLHALGSLSGGTQAVLFFFVFEQTQYSFFKSTKKHTKKVFQTHLLVQFLRVLVDLFSVLFFAENLFQLQWKTQIKNDCKPKRCKRMQIFKTSLLDIQDTLSLKSF